MQTLRRENSCFCTERSMGRNMEIKNKLCYCLLMTAIVFHCDRNNEYKNTEYVCLCILSSANFAQSLFEWKCSGHAFQFPLNSSNGTKNGR